MKKSVPMTEGFEKPSYEPRQGRKAATVVCSTSAVVTLAFFQCKMKN
jgi:hypothetical protein